MELVQGMLVNKVCLLDLSRNSLFGSSESLWGREGITLLERRIGKGIFKGFQCWPGMLQYVDVQLSSGSSSEPEC